MLRKFLNIARIAVREFLMVLLGAFIFIGLCSVVVWVVMVMLGVKVVFF